MTVTSRVPALLTYLVTLFTNDATLGQAVPPVTVYDGPPVAALNAPLSLYVGLTDPDSDTVDAAAESQQTWAALGRRARDEIVTVHCVAEAWSGVDTVATQRTAVAGIVAAVETLMQADSTQFGGNVLFPDPGMAAVLWSQNVTANGAIVRAAFDLVFKSRIGG